METTFIENGERETPRIVIMGSLVDPLWHVIKGSNGEPEGKRETPRTVTMEIDWPPLALEKRKQQ